MSGREEVLYSDAQAQPLKIAQAGFGYLFQLTRAGVRKPDFVLREWQAADNTVCWLKREGYTVLVFALAFEPDEDFLTEVLGI